MNNVRQAELTRREFLRSGWRTAALAGIVAAVVYVARTRRSGPAGPACDRGGWCAGCGRLSACGLPSATAYRGMRNGG